MSNWETFLIFLEQKKVDVQFCEAECIKIDAENKKVYCRSSVNNNLNGKEEFIVDYDYLIIAMGANVNTFNTPGVLENCHFLKVIPWEPCLTNFSLKVFLLQNLSFHISVAMHIVFGSALLGTKFIHAYMRVCFYIHLSELHVFIQEVEDAQKIRRTVIDCFERASLPTISDEEKKRILHFAVVGGGPTGVEFAAELHDFINEDLVKLYPGLKDLVKITLLEAGDHILNM